MKNIFWSIYVNIEREVLNLADMIHFTDNQLSVYSVRVSDLLIRCNVEGESLIRELYKDIFGNTLNEPGKMLLALNQKWSLDKKRVSIISTNMHYTEKYASFCPFSYETKGENDYFQAYNAIKHDRSRNFEKYATIHYLLRALGALYILNVYSRKEEVKNIKNNFKIDSSLGSKIFSFNTIILRPQYPHRKKNLSSNDELEAIYVIKPSSGYIDYYNEFERVFEKQCQLLKEYGYVPEKDEEDNEILINYEELYPIAARLGNVELIRRISDIETSPQKKHQEIVYIAKLNTSNEIHYIEE